MHTGLPILALSTFEYPSPSVSESNPIHQGAYYETRDCASSVTCVVRYVHYRFRALLVSCIIGFVHRPLWGFFRALPRSVLPSL